MRAPVVVGEGVDLVDDDRAQAGEELAGRHPWAHEHGLERLGRDEEDVGRVGEEAAALACAAALWVTPVAAPPPVSARIRLRTSS